MTTRHKQRLGYKYYFLSGTQEVRCDLGGASLLAGSKAVVGASQSYKIVYTVGKVPIRHGGAVRFAIPLPFSPPQLGASRGAGYCKASCSRSGVQLSLSVNNSPFTGFNATDGHCGAYARSVFVRVGGGRLKQGDTVTLHYSRAKASMWSGLFDFAVFVDPDGKRRAKNSGYYIVAGFPRVFVEPKRADHFVVYLGSNLGRSNRLTAVARDESDNFDCNYAGNKRASPGGIAMRFKSGVAKASIRPGKCDVLRVKLAGDISNPAVTPGKYNIYWGDLHTHSLLYDGTGTPAEVYTHGRDVTRLDFQSVSEHSFYDPSMWKYVLEAAEAFNEPGKFVTYVGYEARTSDFGDINFYFGGSSAPQPPATKFAGSYNTYPLRKYINSLKGTKALVIPHNHLKPSIDYPAKFQAACIPLVEIYSQWGNFEKPHRPFTLTGRETVSPPQAVVNSLLAGLRFGFTGGSDNHSCHPGYGRHMRANETFQGGLTGVYAKQRTRRSIWDALVRRRCFATTGSRMIITFHVSGVAMGQQRAGAPQQREVRAVVNGQGPLKRIVVVRNGREVKSVDCGGKLDYQLEWTDRTPPEKLWVGRTKYTRGPFMFYYIRVEQQDAQLGWASPVWFDK